MLVLIATAKTQGELHDDHCETIEGELVIAPLNLCAADSGCDCDRGFIGLTSDATTTTAMVADRPDITPQIFRLAIADALRRQGLIDRYWRQCDLCEDLIVDAEFNNEFLVGGKRPGTVIGQTDNQFFTR